MVNTECTCIQFCMIRTKEDIQRIPLFHIYPRWMQQIWINAFWNCFIIYYFCIKYQFVLSIKKVNIIQNISWSRQWDIGQRINLSDYKFWRQINEFQMGGFLVVNASLTKALLLNLYLYIGYIFILTFWGNLICICIIYQMTEMYGICAMHHFPICAVPSLSVG